MAARVSQKVAAEYNPNNYVLMHAMGPIVASTLGSALLAGIFITIYPKLMEIEWITEMFPCVIGCR
jgi:Na+-transporting methylmalonyl-CoA/oxaloacetate decarboxylase beta subunit